MIAIRISGVPDDGYLNAMDALRVQLQIAVAGIKELDIIPGQVSVSFPPNLTQKSLGEEIVVEVSGSFTNDKDIPEVPNQITDIIQEKVVSFVRNHLKQCKLIDIFVNFLNKPAGGFVHAELHIEPSHTGP